MNIEISEVDNYTWTFTSRIFRLALEITFLLNKYSFLHMADELLSQTGNLKKRWRPNETGKGEEGGGGGENSLKKISWGRDAY